MIRINLIPTKAAQKKANVVQQLVVGGIVIAAAVFLSFSVNQSMQSKVDNQQQVINDLNARISQLQTIIKQVDNFKEKKRDLNRKIDTIKQLNDQRSGPVKLMEDFTYVVPRKAWISSYREVGKQLSLEGQALDGPTVSDFIDNLRSSKFFYGVQLIQVSQDATAGVKAVRFSINCRVNYTPAGGKAS